MWKCVEKHICDSLKGLSLTKYDSVDNFYTKFYPKRAKNIENRTKFCVLPEVNKACFHNTDFQDTSA